MSAAQIQIQDFLQVPKLSREANLVVGHTTAGLVASSIVSPSLTILDYAM